MKDCQNHLSDYPIDRFIWSRQWKRVLLTVLILFVSVTYPEYIKSFTINHILIPMDKSQSNHLKAYGVTIYALSLGHKGEWLLNYRGGSFLLPAKESIKEKASLMNVTYEALNKEDIQRIYQTIEKGNMSRIELLKMPKIAVYTPPGKEPWDDAVTLVMAYAEIPYDKVWDPEVFNGDLSKYDWLHLHHEDFTGQFGKFFSYKRADWYVKRLIIAHKLAERAGFESVQGFKGFIAEKIRAYVKGGGYLFAMCSATDTVDIALSANGVPSDTGYTSDKDTIKQINSHMVDIIEKPIDGTPVDTDYQKKLDFKKTFAFQNFTLYTQYDKYEHSSIDVDIQKEGLETPDTFQLFDFSAKIDPVPTMLNQNHVSVVKGFLGQTTGFYRKYVKPGITVLGETGRTNRIKYIHGSIGRGTFTFYAGHDPEDYKHTLGEPPTNLALYPNSPGYRLILNNILFPSAKKQKQKT